MPENEFEKKIFSEMQGLKISPSEEVWGKVEERIRKKRKKRFLVIILFAGLALFGYWQRDFLLGHRDKKITETTPTTEPAESKPIKQSENFKTPDNDISSDKGLNKEPGNPEAADKNSQLNTKAPTPRPLIPIDKKKTAVIRSDSKSGNQKKPVTAPVLENKIAIKEKDKPADPVTGHATIDPVKKEPVEEKDSSSAIQTETGKEISKDENKEIITGAQEIPREDSAAKKIEKPAAKRSWKWGVHFSPGISSINKNPVPLNISGSADLNGLPNSGAGSPGPPAAPSESQPGFAFQAGVFVQRDISPRSIFSAGLQLGYYTDRIRVGSRRDSVISYSNQFSSLRYADYAYSAANTFRSYTNRYYFLELPVYFQWSLGKNNLNPFTLTLGATAGQMISTNALVYDTAFGGTYHNSRTDFNKTQFSLSTGLDWHFSPQGPTSWSMGPVLDFHLNRVLNNPFDKNKYLLFSGIRARLLFTGKK